MKRIIICTIAVLLCLQACALAEDAYWTRNADFYYHAVEACGGEEGRVPISDEAALAFDKYACPVCMHYEDEGGDVDAVVRGGTIVARFQDAWLAEQELTDVFGWSSQSDYRGKPARRMLAEYLHGEDYAAFMNAWRTNSAAEGRANLPHVLSADGTLVMNRRHIGNCWYVVVRPWETFGDRWDMYWRVNSYALRMQEDVLSSDFDRQTVEETLGLQLESMNGTKPVYERSETDMEIAVYRGLDGNIAVIREKNPGKRSLENVWLHIEGAPEAIELSGYAEDNAAIYCCVLTEGELAAVQKNAGIEIRHMEAVNSRVYRIAGEDEYRYYTVDEDELLFSVSMENGLDPVDGSFRAVLEGEAGCFVVQTSEMDYIMDYEGNEYHPGFTDGSSQRITPLVWYGQTGVLLSESGEDFAVGAYLLPGGVEFGEKYDLANGNSRLINERGLEILSGNYTAFTVLENGEIHMEAPDGEIAVYVPNIND